MHASKPTARVAVWRLLNKIGLLLEEFVAKVYAAHQQPDPADTRPISPDARLRRRMGKASTSTASPKMKVEIPV